MKVLATELLVFCDVDDTLVMHNSPPGIADVHVEDPLTPHRFITLGTNQPIIRLLREKHQRGYTVIVWSLGGYQWASNVVEALGLTDVVSMVMTKPVAYIDDKAVETWMSHRIYLDADTNYKV